ncbi:DUF692 domain-containing protein [Paraliomyxa miuraensis]|uniref:DUF692 domain-containing protein n=1 Tax=Paraliomyxa miuraensis TaxID=376150 RepID=UPI002253BCE7|nr:DUF692 domain-containing protein [Paraliomyxa miuraensis]MCX4247281.1 DUF692 domain-containing protein [Paraliomyxa miuraensis]
MSMFEAILSTRSVPTGIGLGLRARFIDRVARGAADGVPTFVELCPENYMHRGGRSPARLEEVAQRFPVICHGLMMSLGSTDPFEDAYFAQLRAFLDRYDPPWHSDHLCWSGLHGAVLHDLLPVPFTSAVARRVASRVVEARDRLERPMAVENISWYAELGASQLDEVEFLVEILERADCGLLLDVNNVFVNAQNHGFDPLAWLERIPLERVVQLHVAGHESWEEDLIIDTHGATVRDEVYELMAWVIERTGPRPVLLERDSNIPPLPELLDEIRRLDGVYQQALSRWEADRSGGSADVRTAKAVGHA